MAASRLAASDAEDLLLPRGNALITGGLTPGANDRCCGVDQAAANGEAATDSMRLQAELAREQQKLKDAETLRKAAAEISGVPRLAPRPRAQATNQPIYIYNNNGLFNTTF